MSERTPIEWTREYIIANAIPENEKEKAFIKKYKKIFDLWDRNLGYDVKVFTKLSKLNKRDIAKEIYARFERKRNEENLRKYKEETEAYTEAMIKKIREDREKALAKYYTKHQAENENSKCAEFEFSNNVTNKTLGKKSEEIQDSTRNAQTEEVPNNITFAEDGMPIFWKKSDDKPYGDYTVFYNSKSGIYHVDRFCSLYSSKKEHRFNVIERGTPCKKCAKGFFDFTEVPLWFKNGKQK